MKYLKPQPQHLQFYFCGTNFVARSPKWIVQFRQFVRYLERPFLAENFFPICRYNAELSRTCHKI